MLFTRCPNCQTTFRISADTLRVASGHVRCGSCATVFSAFSGLQQDSPDEMGPVEDNATLSPTMQTRELAGIEEIESPPISDEGLIGPAEIDADSTPSARSEQIEPEAPAIAILAQDEAEAPLYDAPSESAEDPEPAVGLETEVEDPVKASELSDELQFDAPADDWTQLLSEIEQSSELGAAEDPEEVVELGETARDDDEPESEDDWDVDSATATPAWSETEAPEDDTGGRVARSAPDDATPTERAAEPLAQLADPEAEVAAILATESDISAEQIDATLSAEPDSDILAALEAGLTEQPASGRKSRLWMLGSAALALVLSIQAAHHFRTQLASQSAVGPIVQSTYGLLGLDLVPDWDLGQYEILNWVAAEAGLGNLRITAQIRNNGPRAQPYPHVHLELKDRWEAVVGSRVFEPVEYLGSGVTANAFMAAGETIPADLAVVDPGQDAYGFELDICLETGAGRVGCAADRVFAQ